MRIRVSRGLGLVLLAASIPACGGGGGGADSGPPRMTWTWMSGSATPGAPGVYGTKGTPDTANVPGGRQLASGWTDVNGHFWLIGGFSGGYYNDLWRWDGAAWTWMSGSASTNQNGVYGTKGVAAPGNQPGGRSAPHVWVDAAGDAWMLGGNGYASTSGAQFLNDLWRWDGSAWTWVAGSDQVGPVGSYGVQGVPAAANTPGGRLQAALWHDPAGDTWLYGGNGYGTSAAGNGELSDLWRWDGSAWTWMAGTSTLNVDPVYGVKGVPAPANTPGGRHDTVVWRSPNGDLWLFGGLRIVPPGVAVSMNDLWRWDGAQWAWMAGTTSTNAGGAYGVKGVSDPANTPGSRTNAAGWTTADGVFWLFGGGGYDASGTFGTLNDLWRWDGTAWTWISGTSSGGTFGTYGVLGTADPANLPGSHSSMVPFLGSQGTLWFWGGFGRGSSGQGDMNDLWRYRP